MGIRTGSLSAPQTSDYVTFVNTAGRPEGLARRNPPPISSVNLAGMGQQCRHSLSPDAAANHQNAAGSGWDRSKQTAVLYLCLCVCVCVCVSVCVPYES